MKNNIKFIIFLTLTIGIALLLLVRQQHTTMEVVVISPNLDQPISPTSKIVFNFKGAIDNYYKKTIYVLTKPTTQIAYTWNENNLMINPELFLPSYKYTLRIYSTNKLLSEYNFTVKLYNQLSSTEKDSYEIAQFNINKLKNTKILEQRPWLKELPIRTPQFSILFDYENKTLRVRLINSSQLTDNAIYNLKKEISNRLLSINIDPNIAITYIED